MNTWQKIKGATFNIFETVYQLNKKLYDFLFNEPHIQE